MDLYTGVDLGYNLHFTSDSLKVKQTIKYTFYNSAQL